MGSDPIVPGSETDGGGAAPAGETVTISRAELDSLRARAEAATPPADIATERGRQATAEALDRAAEETASRDRRLSEMERVCKAALKERELATALAGRPLVPGAAAQLIKLWRDDVDVHDEGDGYRVAVKDGRAVSKAVGDWLASAEFSHFCLPSSKGGTGAKDASRPAGGGAAPGVPKNLGEAVVMRWRDEAAAKSGGPAAPIGLRRHR